MLKLFRSTLSFFLTLLLRLQSRSIGKRVRANGFVRGRELYIGEDCHFNGMRVFGRGIVRIGDNFHSGVGLKILTEVHNYEGSRLPYDDTTIVKNVKISDNVWVGMDVCILGGVTIGEGAIIQARSVVVKDVPPLAIVGGHPALPYKFRNKAHYERLKGEKCSR